MKRLAFLFLLILAAVGAYAQEMGVESMRPDMMDMTAATHQRHDLNGTPCAIVKVRMPEGAAFEGSIIGDTEYRTGEYWVYMTAGTKFLRVKHPSARPLHISFADHGISRLDSKATYILDITMPASAAPARSAASGRNYAVFAVEPPTATVTIDGAVHEPRSGKVRVLLRLGAYDYSVEAPGYLPEHGRVTVGADKAELTVRLRSTKGTLAVTSATPGTEIYVNGERVGTGTWQSELAPGEYLVEGRRAGFTSAQQTAVVSTGQTTSIALAALRSTKGTLAVSSATPGTEIYVNGERMGTGTWQGELAPGEYLVEGRLASHRPVEQLATLVMGEQSTVALPALSAITGSLNVDFEPDGATITVDGTARGTAPAMLEGVLAGTHSVTISATGYTPQTHEVTIADSQTTTITGSLSKITALPFTLCAEAPDGSYRYFSAPEWRLLSISEQNRYKKKGVVLSGNGETFLVELQDMEGGKQMKWEKARKYSLPTKEQSEILVKNSGALNSTLRAFGGNVMEHYYWTRTESGSSYAWYVGMYSGNVFKGIKSSTYRVRAVAPVPAEN